MSQSGHKTFDVNLELIVTLINAGIEEAQINTILSTLNLPPIHKSLLKRNECIVGPQIELLVKESYAEGIYEEAAEKLKDSQQCETGYPNERNESVKSEQINATDHEVETSNDNSRICPADSEQHFVKRSLRAVLFKKHAALTVFLPGLSNGVNGSRSSSTEVKDELNDNPPLHAFEPEMSIDQLISSTEMDIKSNNDPLSLLAEVKVEAEDGLLPSPIEQLPLHTKIKDEQIYDSQLSCVDLKVEPDENTRILCTEFKVEQDNDLSQFTNSEVASYSNPSMSTEVKVELYEDLLPPFPLVKVQQNYKQPSLVVNSFRSSPSIDREQRVRNPSSVSDDPVQKEISTELIVPRRNWLII